MSHTNFTDEELYSTIIKLNTIEDAKAFFEDLCSTNEIVSMKQRIHAAKLLIEGKTYEQVIALTDISSATLSRVSKCVKNGTGYKNFINIKKIE